MLARLPFIGKVIRERDNLRQKLAVAVGEQDDLRNEQNDLRNRLAAAHSRISYHPDLVPPPDLMIREQIEVLEEWYRWGEEWNIVLRVFGHTWKRSRVLEIGCGLGRIAFPLRFTLLEGAYEGFDICEYKIQFLQERFQKKFPNFRFSYANVKNTAYNPSGSSDSSEFTFPYEDSSFDTVYAASVFTHLLPAGCRQYFRETARVLRPDGRAVFSFFLLDFYVPGRPRPLGFAKHYFDFTHRMPGDCSDQFAIANPENPEETIAYNLRLIREFADEAGLVLDGEPLPGLWSGADGPSIGAQDLLILRRA